ncbi:MAG: TVP38/TMEM64 family protein [Proteobacteria bacterium]|nr:TVP38/TMEM64 family protein [Pseudomonadota bacterium]
MNMNTKKIGRWLPLAILVILIGGAWLAGLDGYFTLQRLQMRKTLFLDYAAAHPVLSAALFTGAYAATAALSLPVATPMTLLGGFVFGPWAGTLLVVTGATAGAAILFLIARSALGNALREKAGPLYKKIETGMNENAVSFMLFMRLVPIFPFFVVNIVLALFNVGLRAYILTTFFGIMPASFIYVNLGGALADMDSLSDLISGRTLLAFTLLGLLALVPALYKEFRKKNPR